MTITIDVNTQEGPFAVPTTDTIIASGSGEPLLLSDAVDRIEFALAAGLKGSAGSGAAALTALVEHSDDGASWSTAASLSFTTRGGTQKVSVSSPKLYLRVSWSGVTGHWTLAVTGRPAEINKPASDGGSLPASWTVNADGSFSVAPTNNTDASLSAVVAPTGFRDNSSQGNFVAYVDEDGRQTFTLDTYGDLILRGSAGMGVSAIELQSADFGYTMSLWSGDSDASNGGRFLVTAGATAAGFTDSFSIRTNGSPTFKTAAVLADGAISNGECSLWYDKTNGAAKLKIKAKQANGTVVVGEVALT